MRNRFNIYLLSFAALSAGLAACSAGEDYPGMEYAPQMYHSVPYEPLSQITDESQGKWLSARADERGEFFNTNPYNPNRTNMRLPAEGTVPRNVQGYLPFRMPKDTAGGDYYLKEAAANLKNPLVEEESIITDGKVLYTTFCYPCHGIEGRGDGPVGMVYKGEDVYTYIIDRRREHCPA